MLDPVGGLKNDHEEVPVTALHEVFRDRKTVLEYIEYLAGIGIAHYIPYPAFLKLIAAYCLIELVLQSLRVHEVAAPVWCVHARYHDPIHLLRRVGHRNVYNYHLPPHSARHRPDSIHLSVRGI